MSSELIKVVEDNGRQVVSLRELHKGLEITERFSNWFDRMLKYGFEENTDYVGCKVFNTLAKQELQDYAITLDMAKEISMIQRNEIGKKFRQYFIECEKKLMTTQPKLPTTYKEALLALVEEVEKNEQLQLENKQQKQIIMEYEPKVSYYDMILNAKGTMTITQIAKDYGLSACEMNKKLHELGIQYKQSDTWLLYSKYAKFGYTQSKPHMYENSNGDKCTKLNTKWTQKGRLFLYEELKRNGVVPNIEKNN